MRTIGIYQVHISTPTTGRDGRCTVYRNGRVLTTTRGATPQAALREARRNVRMARHCGPL
jgi:hypothetical protein